MEINFKRFLSLLLALVMVIGMMPVGHVHAEGETVNILSAPVTEVQADVEYQLFYNGNRCVHGSVNTRNGFTGLDTGGGMSTSAIAGNDGYIWTLKAADGGYRLYSAYASKYAKLAGSSASLQQNEADASVFVFEHDAATGTFKIKTTDGLYFNNLGGNDNNIMGGYGSNAVVFTIRQVMRNHTHEATIEIPATEATLNSPAMTAGKKCVCGQIMEAPVANGSAKDYNDGIVPVDKIIPTAGSYNPNHQNDGGPAYALDSNFNTRWHTNYSGNNDYGENTDENQWIDFGIDGAYDVTALRYKGRNGNGDITKYTIKVSYDGVNYEDLIVGGTWTKDDNWKEVVFETPLKNVKNVRLLAVEHVGAYAIANEMRLVGVEHHHAEVEIPAVAVTIGADGKTAGEKCSTCGEILLAQEVIPALYKSKAVPNSAFIATVGSAQGLGGNNTTEGPADLALDDNFGTMWHTNWNGTDAENLWFDFELTTDYEVTGLYYKPRTPNSKGEANGLITKYQILGSYDGEEYFEIDTGDWAFNDSWKSAEFNGVQVKHIRLKAVESYSTNSYRFASAVEIRLVGTPCDHTHRYTAAVTAPTCTEAGYTTYTCACGDTYTEAGEAATGHDYKAVVTAPDCVNGGHTTYTCACGDSYVANETAALGHTAGAEADCVNAQTCTVCGAELVAALGHTPAEAVKENEVAPTLNSTGSYESVVKCAKCGTELSRETVTVPALIGAAAEIDGYKYATFEAALEAAEAGDTIVLLKEVTVTADTTYEIPANVTVESAGDAFVVSNGATLTLNGNGTVEAGTSGVGSWCAVFADGGNVVINGGTYSVGGDKNSETTDPTHQNDVIYTKNDGTATINGGTFLNNGTVWTLNKNDSTGGDITVTGGTFEGFNPADNVSEGANTSFVPADYCSYEETTNTWTVVKGHTPAEAVKENEVAPTLNSTGSYESVVKCAKCGTELSRETVTVPALIGAVAEIDGYKYATFEAALEAAEAGDTIVLLKEVTVTADTTYEIPANVTVEAAGDAFVVTSGTLTLNGDGAVKAGTSGVGSWCAVFANGGSVVINGGTYSVGGDKNSETTDPTHQNDVIYTKNDGTATINGGTFLNNGTVWTLNQNDTTGGAITVYGGTFEGFNPADNVSEGANTNFVAEGYCSRENEGTWTVVEGHIPAEAVKENEKAATCTDDGSYESVVYCSECDAELSRVTNTVTATGHVNTSVVDAKEATCGEEGYTGDTVCDCGETVEKGSVIPATGEHTAGEAVKENETETGYDLVVYCSVCGKELSRETVEVGLSGSGTQEDPFMINNLEELILFRDSVNDGETTYNADGVYVALGANIDMKDVNWSVNIGDDCNATFDGIFDGNGKTISNLNSTETAAKADRYVCAGLFGAIYGNAVVKNLTIENANINTGNFEGSNAAVVVGFAYNCTGSVENVTVKNSTINATGTTGTGAIVGYAYGSKLDVINCSVENTDITGAAYVGGIIGYAAPNCSIVDCSVKDATINATSCAAGGIAGIIVESGNITGASVKNVDLTSAHQNWQNAAGAVVGTITHKVAVTADCEEITINGAESNTLVGSVHADKPANPLAKIQARIDNTYYTTLDEAVKAAKANDTITLLQPVEVTADTTYEIPANVTVEAAGDAFVVSNGATLTLNGNGTVKAGTSGVGSWCAVFANGGNVVINGGTYSVGGDKNSETTDPTHQNDVIYTKNGGTATINGGTFLNDGTVWTLNENDANRGTITVYGGTFAKFNPANNASEGEGTNFVAEGYCSRQEGESWTVYDSHKWEDADCVNPKTCSACGATEGTALGHKYESEYTAPDFGKDGYTTYTCSVCGDSYVKTDEGTAKVAVASVTMDDMTTYYESLPEAVAHASTTTSSAPVYIDLLMDAAGPGAVFEAKNTQYACFELRLNGHTYTFTEGVGSTGTESNGFQILSSACQVNISNGTLQIAEGSADKFYTVIQNYADLCLTDVKVDATNADKWAFTDGDSYAVSINSGWVMFNGATEIIANNDGDKAFAFDVYDHPSYEGAPKVSIYGEDVVIKGNIEAVATSWGGVAYYGTFESALAGGDNTIELLVPVTVTKDTTYDLSGKTITSAGDAFVVTGGTLTLNGDGTVEAGTSGVGSWCAVFANGGNVVINGGTYSVGGDSSTTDTTHQNDVIYTKNGGTATINGGTFLNDGTVWTLNENDANRGTITVTGGTFEGFNPADNASEGANTNFVAEGYCAYNDNGTYTVKKHTEAEAVKENEKAATCTVDGSYDTVVYCSNCNEELSRVTNTVTATGHVNTSVVGAKEATCGEDGYTGDTVCDCGETVEKGSVIPATGNHTAGEAVKENEKPATCGADGSYESVVYCSECDAELSRETIPVLATGEHTAGEPVKEKETETGYDLVVYCSVCGAELSRETVTNPVETAKVTLTGRQVFYDAELEMRVYLTIPESLANVDVVISKDGRWGAVSETVKGTELKTDSNGTYISIGVASGEMTRDITVEVLDGETALTLYGSAGNELGTSYTSTVKAWADWMVKNGDAKRKAAASAMLVYGGYAQKHFGVDADAPAYEGIVIPDLSAVTTDTVAAYATTQTNANLGVAAVGLEAYMDSYIEYRVYLSGNAEGYNFTVSGPDRTNEAVEAAYDAEEAKYYVSILDIAAAHMDETFTITVADANGNTNVITTSVLSWVRSVVNNPELFTEAQIDLAKALYLYCVATSDLFGQ